MTGRKDDERDREREGQRNVSALTIREIALVEDCFEDSAIREIRLARALDRWNKLAEPYRSAAREALARVAAKADLSNDVREVVGRALAE